MRLRFWDNKEDLSDRPLAGAAAPTKGLDEAVTHRQFLKMVAAALGGIGLGWLAGGTPKARATYTPGSPDTVNTSLNVQGDLTVTSEHGPGNVGIGTASPQGKLDVAGAILVNGEVAVDSQGVASSSYFAP